MAEEFDARSNALKLLKTCSFAALATLADDMMPFASLVGISARDGEPILLLSDLAVHTQNLKQRPAASLLLADEDEQAADPLVRTRLTLTGRILVCADQKHAKEQYLRHHPLASSYAGFADFAYYRMESRGAHIVAGFGRIATIPVDRLFAAVDG